MKKVFLLVSMLVLMMSSVCFAKVNMEDLNLGGIYIGQPIDEVINIYGEPLKQPTAPKGYDFIFSLDGGNFVVRPTYPYQGKESIVEKITLKDDIKSLKTHLNIGLYASREDVINTYGAPDNTDEEYVVLSDNNRHLSEKVSYITTLVKHPDDRYSYGQLDFYFVDNVVSIISFSLKYTGNPNIIRFYDGF